MVNQFRQEQLGFPHRRLWAAGGGGLVDDMPQTWLGTHSHYGIQIVESISQIAEKIKDTSGE